MNEKEQPKPSIFYYFGGQSPANLAGIRRNIAKKVGVHPRATFFEQFGNDPHVLYYSFDGLNRLDHIHRNNAIVGYIIQMGEEIKPSECVELSKLEDLQDANIETRVGEKVRVLCTDAKNSKPIVVAITDEHGEEIIRSYTKEGKPCIERGVPEFYSDLVCYENIPPQLVFIKVKTGCLTQSFPVKPFVLQTLQAILNANGTAKKLNAVKYLRGELPSLSLKTCKDFIDKAVDEGHIVAYDVNGIFVREYVIDF